MMTELPIGNRKNRNEDIDSKIADFMADIDEIVLGKKSNNHLEQSEWQQCFDETTQAVYYWNCKTNECSWNPPPSHTSENSIHSNNTDDQSKKRRQQSSTEDKSAKKMKKPCLIAEYTSSESESSEEEGEENVDDIDELLNEVLDKKEKIDQKPPPIDPYPLFEVDCRAAITRLVDLGDKTTEVYTLRIQLQTRLEDCLAGHLSKSYAVHKLEEALIQIDELENLHIPPAPSPYVPDPPKPSLTTSEMALLLSLPPPPPPPSPPPPSNVDDPTLQLFYAQLNCDQPDPISSVTDIEKPTIASKSEFHHHHHHKDKKSKPAKTLPTDLIQKWTHARQELRGEMVDIDDS